MFKDGIRPTHPGEVLLEDYIKPMGVSVRAVSIALHVPYWGIGHPCLTNEAPACVFHQGLLVCQGQRNDRL